MPTIRNDAIRQCTEQLTVLAQEIAAELPGVQADYPTLDLATRLMRRHGSVGIVDAMRAEARARVLRNRYASMTREAA